MNDLDIYEQYDLLEEIKEQREGQLAEAREECAALVGEVRMLRDALRSLVAVARRYLPDGSEHPEIQKADDALDVRDEVDE